MANQIKLADVLHCSIEDVCAWFHVPVPTQPKGTVAFLPGAASGLSPDHATEVSERDQRLLDHLDRAMADGTLTEGNWMAAAEMYHRISRGESSAE